MSYSEDNMDNFQSALRPTAPEFNPSSNIPVGGGAIRKTTFRNTYSNSHAYNSADDAIPSSSRNSNNPIEFNQFSYETNSSNNAPKHKKYGNENKRHNYYGNNYYRNDSHRRNNSEKPNQFKQQNSSGREDYDYDRHGNHFDKNNKSGASATALSNNNKPKFERDNFYRDNFYRDNLHKFTSDARFQKSESNPRKSNFQFDNRRGNNSNSFFSQNNSKEKQSNKSDDGAKAHITKNDDCGQRESLTAMIKNYRLECLVCCDKIRNTDKIWSCSKCFHIIHLNCIFTWAKSSKVGKNWRCPACQNIYAEIPKDYKCFCGKMLNPCDPHVLAHSCGDMCLKKKKKCDHKCCLQCHPGPCPECNVMVKKTCCCGSTEQSARCSLESKFTCELICNKELNCGVHQCKEICHMSECPLCKVFIIQECFCGKTGRKVQCNAENSRKLYFTCENECQKLLSCGNHRCQKQCHIGACESCKTDANSVKSCCCGKTPLLTPRVSCLDPIPCCENVCGKVLACGHSCMEKCHENKCPSCPLVTVVRCRCGQMTKEIPCAELPHKSKDITCQKRCTKKRSCGKHKCNQLCCIESEHICPIICNRPLKCGLHRCTLSCHSGRCQGCQEVSFEELHCECGASTIYPPIPCGTKPPLCKELCSRPRPCGHPQDHECHSGSCPQCCVLTKRWCYGRHEERAAIPCFQENFSCGLPCGKPMPCGKHKCIKPCHADGCPTPCTQPCNAPRSLCGHACNKPCHFNEWCPESVCKFMMPITCQCGLQKSTKICSELTEEFKNLQMATIKDKIHQSDDITDAIWKPSKLTVLKVLECNDDCKVYERNRRLAIGLQIPNADHSQKLVTRYNDFLKQWGKKDPHFCQKVHDKLTELVQLARQSKQKSRAYSFEPMNRDKRHFIHQYCEYFGLESEAYDKEPNRNVVATAIKDKSFLPGTSLLETLQRENGQRKVPGPMIGINSLTRTESSGTYNVLNKVQK